jgi:hypothetical protein
VVGGKLERMAVVFDRTINLALPLIRSCATSQGDGQVSLRHPSTSYYSIAAPNNQRIAKTAIETLPDIGIDALTAGHSACRSEKQRQNGRTKHRYSFAILSHSANAACHCSHSIYGLMPR